MEERAQLLAGGGAELATMLLCCEAVMQVRFRSS